MPGMDSKILVAVELLVLVCLFSLESASCSTKGFQITRDSRDSFKIPPSKCDSTNQSFDYCAEYNAKKDREKTPCDCVCDASSSTFEFRNNAWSCRKNNETRASFGCGMFFDNEDNATQLNSLKYDDDEELKWRAGRCTINLQDSSYIKCLGKGVSGATAMRAQIQSKGDSQSSVTVNELEIKYSSGNDGGIVKLKLECKGPDFSTTVGCLLFKLQGSTSCPVAGTPETTPLPTAVETLSKEIFSPPDSSAGKQTKRLDDLSIFLIVGLTISLSLLFVIVGTFVYRRNCARNHLYWDTDEHSSHSNPDSERGEKDASYASLSHCTTTTYASAYNIPSTMGGINTLDGEEPIYSTVDEYQDPAITESPRKVRPLSVEQRVYNLVEVLDTSAPDGSYEYCSNEVSQAQSPLSVEQRVYNVIEGLDVNTSDGPHGDVAQEGAQESQVPLSVEQRVYNLVEPLDNTNTLDGPSEEGSAMQPPISVEQRLYNTIEPLDTVTCQQGENCDPKSKEIGKYPFYKILEEPLPSDIEHGERNRSSSVKEHVYNVPEELKVEGTKEPSDASASLDSSRDYDEPIEL